MKRIAIVGTGGRGYMSYGMPISERFQDCAQLVGLCDINPKRVEYVSQHLAGNPPAFTDFDTMLNVTNPDTIIITTVDRFHSEYVVRSLDRGLDVICEKPLAIHPDQCQAILDAERRNHRKISVIFNMRYMAHMEKLKEVMLSGAIGKVMSVDFQELLDTSHGASYFRRWHRLLDNSGGLLVHKATHHFDIINWLIEQDPVSVYAIGTREFYGNDRRQHGPTCRSCSRRSSCEFDLKGEENATIRELYFDCEDADGYLRDRCPFDSSITMYDNTSLSVQYSGGALLSYSLIAHSPYEGFRLSISGSNGRLETWEHSSGPESGDSLFHIKIYNRQGDLITYDTPPRQGNHGGADDRILSALMRGVEPTSLHQHAGSREGVMSVLIGIGANESIKTGTPIRIQDMIDVDTLSY
ncbi:Gfo/Idh/MocA family oxidoreductase [Bianquea renquensis]|uniref:Gfo/Idh/MocA family oxidoreductase n=1 Tax=Bianquea renquensis TaxID=2763661 RepID=A0A926DSQ6_9FIRM|nr:Gfo/Idh/MocA family oxidoreductase [Bianquea renquensis]MBC8544585.1 Gfo/Idh/MocA family oxidoreductase [Bianquea renquensis]